MQPALQCAAENIVRERQRGVCLVKFGAVCHPRRCEEEFGMSGRPGKLCPDPSRVEKTKEFPEPFFRIEFSANFQKLSEPFTLKTVGTLSLS